MEQFEKFDSKVLTLKTKLELTQSEYEYSILSIALSIVRNYYENSENESDLETLCSITLDALKQIRKLVKPF